MPGNRYFSMLSEFLMTQNWKLGKLEDFLEINGIIEENPKIGLNYRKIVDDGIPDIPSSTT